MNRKYQPVIGLEIHVELKTKSKMFCQCKADYFNEKPNSNTCPVCLGLPGALPVPNKKAIDWTILIGKALNCTINNQSKFDRKHYFYPDLPKGYQISQYDEPIASKGKFRVQNLEFRITRVHLEEDTAKLIHAGNDTLVNFNRSGVPLVEIVTEPDFDNSDDVKKFLEELQVIIRYLGVSDADMERGTMRLEPNISVKLKVKNEKLRVDDLPKYKVEVKNINSFRFVKQAIDYEIIRQIELLEKGETPKQETRGFDEKKVITYSQRSKEEAHDYRYFPEPDIPPMTFDGQYLDKIFRQIPELPQAKIQRYVKDFKIKEQDAFIITRIPTLAVFFESVIPNLKSQTCLPARQVSKLNLKIQNYEQNLANIIINKKISTNLSPSEFTQKVLSLSKPKKTNLKLLDTLINRLIEVNQKTVEDYKKGKQNALMFLVGQVMKEMKGKADAKIVIERLRIKLH